MFAKLLKILKVIWASPNSFLGMLCGVPAMPFGTRLQIREGCVEFHGGPVTAVLRRVPFGGSVAAMTLGHTILGRSRRDLDRCRDHEQVHVRQYERWGPFFLPAYLGWSLVLWLQNKDAYLDNPFEVEAYTVADPQYPGTAEDHENLA